MIHYQIPRNWISYDPSSIFEELTSAKAVVLALTSMPYQRSWADALQGIQLKREVAGTSRIEGADFTDRELDAALRESPDQLFTRSQKQAAAAVKAYRWIASLKDDRPVDSDLICDVHRLMVAGADDDHCPPGEIRKRDQNVTFGNPKHRGVDGGSQCTEAFTQLSHALKKNFPSHDLLIQALALHYHFAAMHPFLDGNGRTARALEALMLQRAGLRDTLFIAMSNYYYDEKTSYLDSLSQVRAQNHDLTPFLIFGLRGIKLQCNRLLGEIKINLSKALFKNQMIYLFHRLQTAKKRVIAQRHLSILNLLLEAEEMTLDEIIAKTENTYESLGSPRKTLIRDLNYLLALKAIKHRKTENGTSHLSVRLEWPTEITETVFFEQVKKMPKGKSHSFLT